MYAHTRTPVEDANIEAHFQASKPLISNAASQPRIMSAAIMGEWLRARPGVTEDALAIEFTKAELRHFLNEARDYAIRRSGDVH
jgi:hypothetical protein